MSSRRSGPKSSSSAVRPVAAVTSSYADTVAGLGSRTLAAVIDHAILLGIDVVVFFSTLRMTALTTEEWRSLPLLPFLAFLIFMKLAYFSAFTAMGGQTIGKMAARIRVVADDQLIMDPARAIKRTLTGVVSLASLGLGSDPGPDRARSACASRPRGAHARSRSTIRLIPQAPAGSGLLRMRLGLFIATCGYLGYVPVAPGTFGSAAGLVVFAAVRWSGSPAVELAVMRSPVRRRRVERERRRETFRRCRSGASHPRRSRRAC